MNAVFTIPICLIAWLVMSICKSAWLTCILYVNAAFVSHVYAHQVQHALISAITLSTCIADCRTFSDCTSCVQSKDCYFCGSNTTVKCNSFTSDIFSIKVPSCPGLKYNWSTCSVTVADILVIICVCAAILLLACCCCLACSIYCCCCKRCGYLPL